MAVKTLKVIDPANALKASATKVTVSSSSTTPVTLAASKTKLADANKPAVVLNENIIREAAVRSETATSGATSKSTATAIQAATALTVQPKEPTISRPRITPVAPTSSVVTSPIVTRTPSVPKSTSDKIASILDAAISTSEEEALKKKLEKDAEEQKQALMYELTKSASQGENREDGTLNPEEVDLNAMQQEAAKAEAERIAAEQAAKEQKPDAPAEDKPTDEPKWYEKLMENKTAVICVAVAVLTIIVVIVKKARKG